MPRFLRIVFVLLLGTTGMVSAQKTIETEFWDHPGMWLSNMSKLEKTRATEIQHFDAQGHITEVINPDHHCCRIVYSYNGMGQLRTETEFNYLGDTQSHRLFIYRGDGRLDTLIRIGRDKMGGMKTTYEQHFYDPQGQLSRTVRTQPGYDFRYVRTYNHETDNGRHTVTEYRQLRKHKYEFISANVFNDQGLLIEERYGQQRVQYVYEYDASGEWTIKRLRRMASVWGNWVGKGKSGGEYRRRISN